MSNVTVQEALKQAIEALEDAGTHTVFSYEATINECKSALSEIEKYEPVAIVNKHNSHRPYLQELKGVFNLKNGTKLYTSPQPRDWVGLSDSEWVNIVNHDHAYDSFTKDDAVHYAVKATEEKLKQLNTKG